MIRLSIITVVLNGEKYIETCIQNVIHQLVEGIEHLIIDGNSTDRTVQIIQEYVREYNHIRYFSEKDTGQSEAINKGIKHAKGEIIGLLNVDDMYNFEILPGILDLFDKLDKPSFAVGICAIMDDNRNIKSYNVPYKTSLCHLLSKKYEFPQNPSAYFYHKILHNIYGYYDTKTHNNLSMDLEFILRIAGHIKFHFINEIWGIFLMHKETKTFIEIQDGSIIPRTNKIYSKYYQKLSLFDKIKVLFIKHVSHDFRKQYFKVMRILKKEPQINDRIRSEF